MNTVRDRLDFADSRCFRCDNVNAETFCADLTTWKKDIDEERRDNDCAAIHRNKVLVSLLQRESALKCLLAVSQTQGD